MPAVRTVGPARVVRQAVLPTIRPLEWKGSADVFHPGGGQLPAGPRRGGAAAAGGDARAGCWKFSGGVMRHGYETL